jgi:hypothetical protein
MPPALDFVPVELIFKGLAQKAGDKTRPPDSLTRAVNVTFDKEGVLNKRRGYQFVDAGATVNRFDDDAVMLRVTTRRDELVVFTYDYVAALGSKDGAMRGVDALVYRGPNNRGNGRMEFVATSRLSREAPDETED